MDTVTAPAPRTNGTTRRRLTAVLLASQVFGSTAQSLTLAVGGIIALEITGTAATSGLPSSLAALGTAVASLPLARLMARRGRRPGLALGYVFAVAGSLLCLAGTVSLSFPLLLLGMALNGVGTTSNLFSRFAAADVTPPGERGRAIGLILGAATVGSFLGPSLLDPAASLGLRLGIHGSGSAFLIGVVASSLAATIIQWLLRPDPLTFAQRVQQVRTAGAPPGPTRQVRELLALPLIRLSLTTLVVSQAVMIATTAIGPFYLHTQGHSVHMVGLSASLHLAGMYASSPLTGWLSDRFGRLPVILIGSGILIAATLGAALAPGSNGLLVSGMLFLNGIGWNFAFVASSALLTDNLSPAERPMIQGVGDFGTSFAGALASALGGLALSAWGFPILNVACAVLVLVIPLAALTLRSTLPRTRSARAA